MKLSRAIDIQHKLITNLQDLYHLAKVCYLTSEEHVAEEIRANEYEFTEDGHRA